MKDNNVNAGQTQPTAYWRMKVKLFAINDLEKAEKAVNVFIHNLQMEKKPNTLHFTNNAIIVMYGDALMEDYNDKANNGRLLQPSW